MQRLSSHRLHNEEDWRCREEVHASKGEVAVRQVRKNFLVGSSTGMPSLGKVQLREKTRR
jgi:hypothetical protein